MFLVEHLLSELIDGSPLALILELLQQTPPDGLEVGLADEFPEDALHFVPVPDQSKVAWQQADGGGHFGVEQILHLGRFLIPRSEMTRVEDHSLGGFLVAILTEPPVSGVLVVQVVRDGGNRTHLWHGMAVEEAQELGVLDSLRGTALVDEHAQVGHNSTHLGPIYPNLKSVQDVADAIEGQVGRLLLVDHLQLHQDIVVADPRGPVLP